MLQAIRRTITELLDSKKAVMAVLAMIAMVASRYGFQFTPEQAFEWCSPLIAAVLGQAHVDAAEHRANAMASMALATAPANQNQTVAVVESTKAA